MLMFLKTYKFVSSKQLNNFNNVLKYCYDTSVTFSVSLRFQYTRYEKAVV